MVTENQPQAVSISNDEINLLARAAGYSEKETLDVAGEILKLPDTRRALVAEAFFGGLSYLYKKQPLDKVSLMQAYETGELSALAVANLSSAHNTPSHLQTEDMVGRFFHAVFPNK